MNVETELGAGVGGNLAEPISAETFESFRTIANAAAEEARNRPNPSVRISWFIGFLDTMAPENFTRGDLDLFFGAFPNSEFSEQLQPGETLGESVSDRIEFVVSAWKRGSPILRELIRAYETNPTAVRTTIDFDYTFDRDEQVKFDKLKRYVRIGDLIRSDAGYDDSPIGRLEKILTEGRSAVEEYLGNNCFLDTNDTLEHAFYAIAAPSFEGKTQSAFAFRNIKPLYFSMAPQSQLIYKNFELLSLKLAELSEMDIEHLRRVKVPQGAALDQYISASSLLRNCKDEGFYVLGLFQALIIDGVLNDDYDISWMSYYVTRNRVLKIVPTSINEFLALGDEAISQFCVFLDEFEGIDSNVFIRNLARASKIKIVVSNTNTNVTNLVGRPQAGHSRIDPFAWSIVFTKLNSLNWNLLTRMVPGIRNLIDDLTNQVHMNERSYLDEFFTHFKTVQVEKVRPGFVHLIIEAMREFKRRNATRRFTMETFLCRIVQHLRSQLHGRKQALESTHGRLATMALFLSNAYGPSLGSREDLLFHRKAYLQDHFYYLINPVDISKFCFLTYSPSVAAEQGAPFRSDSPLILFKVSRNGNVLEKWMPERTIFEQDEILVSLALMGLWHKESIRQILEEANVYAQASALTVGSAPNINQAVPNDGNLLEVFSVVSLVNASHRDMNSSEITFTGQSGKSFLTNLIKNLISDYDCRVNNNYQVVFPDDGVTGTIISRIHVPFLFPGNLPIPAMFPAELSNCAEFHLRSVHFGTIERTLDVEQIDGRFDFFLKRTLSAAVRTSARHLDPSQGICTFECKNWDDRNVNLTHLRNIFGKAQGNHADLCLLICNSVVSQLTPETSSIEDFTDECIAQKWEVLRVVQVPTLIGRKVFRIQRFHPNIYLPDPKDYSMTCIIIELEVLNAILR